MPLALTYPLHLEHEIQVLLHEPWPVDNDDVSIQNAGFSYTSKVRYTEKGTKLTLTFRLLTFKDSVAPGELQRYLADLERVEKDLAYTLTVGGKDTAQPRGAWAAILAAVGVVVLVAVVRWTGAGIRGGRPPA